MDIAPPPFHALTQRFGNFDRFTEAAVAWNLHFRRLSRQRDATALTQLGTTERSLHRALIGHFDIAPKRYLNAMRLNAVGRVLLAATMDDHPDTPVAAAGGRLGFWHASQFAADYRRLFGELPSQTLAGTN